MNDPNVARVIGFDDLEFDFDNLSLGEAFIRPETTNNVVRLGYANQR